MKGRWALLLVAIAIGIALIPTMPYGYYQVMRWIVSASFAWIALSAYRSGYEGWTWCWGVIAGIYNPIFPAHANRAVWSMVNLMTIAITAWYAVRTLRPNKAT
jgi:hypothetical protein